MSSSSSPAPVSLELKLPHPYLTTYSITPVDRRIDEQKQLQVLHQKDGVEPLPEALHNPRLFFSDLTHLENGKRPPESINTPWGRARRSPQTTLTWDGSVTLGQVWLVAYAIFTAWPDFESVRLRLRGPEADVLAQQLRAVILAVAHPEQEGAPAAHADELLLLRSTFWQGAGSPFGPRPIWAPNLPGPGGFRTSQYPLVTEYTTTTKFPETRIHARHPIRPAKPTPGSVIYSRWIPHLKETFSMVALDYENPEHLHLFHTWQNDPRVSQGWNETGTLEQHRAYLRRMHEDAHQFAVLAKFEDAYFAYFEVYWALDDHLGAYHPFSPFARGRHSLVGEVRFRGPHRVAAWWSSLIHYLFLDDGRTAEVVGEPKASNAVVLQYDLMHGFGIEKFVDLPHKRSALMRLSRERFFQVCPLAFQPKQVAGTGVTVGVKL